MVTLFLLILAGFVLLIAGADFIVKSSVAMANKLKIPPLIVGLTVVAFGTSAPEFVVSLTSALEGAEGLVLGNVVGSNTANILLILGSSALIFPIYVNRRAFFRDYGFLLLVTLVFVCFALTGVFVFRMGIVMLLMLAAFVVLNYLSAKNKVNGEYVSAWDHKSWPFVIVAAVLGLAAIVYGADLLVDGAVGIAKVLGVSEEVIGLTVIAVGTSLPELATSCVAAWRKQSDLAVGNVLGSNIWNIVFIMGAAAAVTDVEVPAQFVRYDMWVMLAATLLLLLPVWRRAYIGRIYGALFVICYLAYLTSQVLIARGLF